MQQKITRFYRDEEGDWVAEMDCGHTRHMRHDPPWQNRPWVLSEPGRSEWIGTLLSCKECTDLAS
ncbi:MAG: DUF3565 domain-containing protein [Gammaproteobacteria bacterium]